MFETSSELQPRTLRVSQQRWRVPNIAPGTPPTQPASQPRQSHASDTLSQC